MDAFNQQMTQAAFTEDNADKIVWRFSTFEALSVQELYAILALRESIFIVEQDVPYTDIDGKDSHCTHLMGYLGNDLVAYLRIVPVGLFKPGCYSLGRVVLKKELRGGSAGKLLLSLGLEYLDSIRNGVPVCISSQLYLKNFYSKLGFEEEGEPYIEDRIPHIAMTRR
ncbi:GNAT family N-acetyltransferase [Methylobacillus arboreus]|uniref:GNAT family N-acetyltransferase n=1 Tax=Methylobacillus arboreus TaxID=755170 RepID=UPI001E2A098B|nr:GNAT family N-acetyltransferase [Methylobacillus arboreus]MCB5190916.1 GNAT family N-acetyltransferase [Methylobacillus arboreus]